MPCIYHYPGADDIYVAQVYTYGIDHHKHDGSSHLRRIFINLLESPEALLGVHTWLFLIIGSSVFRQTCLLDCFHIWKAMPHFQTVIT